MPLNRSSSLDKVLGRLDDLDSVSLTILVQRLARERHLLETVFNAIQEGILVVNEMGIIEYSNTTADELIGLNPRDVGRAVLWKIVPDLARSLNLNIKEHIEASPSVSREVELTYPEHRHVRLYMVPFNERGKSGEKRRFAIILTDVTADKLSTEKLIENEKISSIVMLAAGVAHELGNPLNSLTIHLQLIRSQLEKLQIKAPLLTKLESSLEVCMNEVQRLDGIIRHFLEAIRPAPPDLNETNVLEVLQEVLHFSADELKNLGIHVDVEIKEDLPIIMADHNQLKQAFFNVLKNAMEAMGNGGDLKIRTHSDNEFVLIHFADSGPGIPQEDLSKIFQPYFTTKKTGSGLGMMIVQRILNDHGGKVGIDSRPDVGTVVTLEFPQKHRRMRLLEEKSKARSNEWTV